MGGQDWERRSPEELGCDAGRLWAGIDYHKTHETPATVVAYDFSTHEEALRTMEGEHATVIGPMPDRRGGPNGVVLKDGYVVAEWGDTQRVDQSFSVAKTFLAIVAGIAWERDLLAPGDRVANTVHDGGFDDPHNAAITWEHLLRNTSEWQGTLFGKPDTVDRNRGVATASDGERGDRDLERPGTHWEYNDVRINRLSLALLRVFERPLPDVLAEAVMEPLGATDWTWHGYENATVSVNDREVTSVPGGGHWGGGLWISTRDLARVGRLLLRGGRWGGDQLVPSGWIDRMRTPGEHMPTYGYLTWLNTDRALWPDAPAEGFAALGFGANIMWVDPAHDLVAVIRWLEPGDRDGQERPNANAVLGRFADAAE